MNPDTTSAPAGKPTVSFDEFFMQWPKKPRVNGPLLDEDTAQLVEALASCLDRGWPELVYQSKAQDPKPPRFQKPEDKVRAVLDAGLVADASLKRLRVLAGGGDERALSLLIQLLVENALWLEGYSCRDKGNLKTVARASVAWPVVWEKRTRRAKNVSDYMKRIELSADAEISLSPQWGKSWHGAGNVATCYARGIRSLLGQTKQIIVEIFPRIPASGPQTRAALEKLPQWVKEAGKLPPLTKESAPKWFAVAWPLILAKHGGHPERDKQLQKLGAHRADKYARRFEKTRKLDTHQADENARIDEKRKSPKRTAATDIRQRIKERILQALVSLSPSQ